MKKIRRLGIRPISQFELEGIMFKKLGEERLNKEKLEENGLNNYGNK